MVMRHSVDGSSGAKSQPGRRSTKGRPATRLLTRQGRCSPNGHKLIALSPEHLFTPEVLGVLAYAARPSSSPHVEMPLVSVHFFD